MDEKKNYYLLKLYIDKEETKYPFSIEAFLLLNEKKKNKIYNSNFSDRRIIINFLNLDVNAQEFLESHLTCFLLSEDNASFVMNTFGIEFGNMNLDLILNTLLRGLDYRELLWT